MHRMRFTSSSAIRSMSLHMQYRRLQDCQKSVSLEPELSDSEKGLLIDSANILKR